MGRQLAIWIFQGGNASNIFQTGHCGPPGAGRCCKASPHLYPGHPSLDPEARHWLQWQAGVCSAKDYKYNENGWPTTRSVSWHTQLTNSKTLQNCCCWFCLPNQGSVWCSLTTMRKFNGIWQIGAPGLKKKMTLASISSRSYLPEAMIEGRFCN